MNEVYEFLSSILYSGSDLKMYVHKLFFLLCSSLPKIFCLITNKCLTFDYATDFPDFIFTVAQRRASTPVFTDAG